MRIPSFRKSRFGIKNIKKLLKPGGTFPLFLPSDPGMLNRLIRKLFVTPSAKKLDFLQYELVNARGIETIIGA